MEKPTVRLAMSWFSASLTAAPEPTCALALAIITCAFALCVSIHRFWAI